MNNEKRSAQKLQCDKCVRGDEMERNGRQVLSVSVKHQHKDVAKRLAEQAGVTESEIIRELLELVSNCHAVWNGCFLKFERPRFQWGQDERERFL